MNKLNPVIRDYLLEDFPMIQQLWSETGLGGPVRGDGPDTIQATLALGGKLLIMTNPDTNTLIGSSWLTVDGRRIHLHHFAISPNYQGQGLAKPLLDASLEFARSTGLQIKLEVHKNNKAGLKFYEREGFQYLGDYLVYIMRDYKTLEL